MTRKPVWWISLLICICMVICLDVRGMETKVDPETKRIRTLYGRVPSSPYTFALEDPRIEINTALPFLTYATPAADLEYARRLARVYLPRTYEHFIGSTDLIVLEDIDGRIFTPENKLWFRRSVEEEGLGLVMGGGSQGFGGNEPFSNWCDTSLNEIIPVECFPNERLSKSYLVKMRVVEPSNELGASLPWEDSPLYYPPNLIMARPGCTVIIESDDNEKTPIYFYWDAGEGRFVGVQNLKGVFGQDFYHWKYFQDSVLNTYYYAAAFPIPRDLETVHELRSKWHEVHLMKQLLMSMIDFVDRFGANTGEIEGGMDEMVEIEEGSDSLYMEQDYVGALREIEEAIAEVKRLEVLSVELKNRALLWIYIIEWLVVSGTALISGVVIWSIMIRRRLYKEVGATTFRL